MIRIRKRLFGTRLLALGQISFCWLNEFVASAESEPPYASRERFTLELRQSRAESVELMYRT
jgi:hypothetical protein